MSDSVYITKKKQMCVIALLFFLCVSMTGYAQKDDLGIWTSLKAQKKVFPGLDTSFEMEMRTRDGLKNLDRWSVGTGLAYKLTSYLKADAGYTFIHSHLPGETTQKGNFIPAYWSPRHRIYLSAIGNSQWKRFNISLRERYQYTYRKSLSVPKYDGDDGSRKEDEWIDSKNSNILRSRFQVEWNLKSSRFSPYASCELYHYIADGWALDKTRWTLGTNYKISKKHVFDLFYRYQDHTDDDDQNGHVLGAGYTFKF